MDVWSQEVDGIRNERCVKTMKEGEMSRNCLSGTGMYIYM